MRYISTCYCCPLCYRYLHGTVVHCVVRYISTWYCCPLCCRYLHGTVAHCVVDIYMVLLPTVLWDIYLHGTVAHCVIDIYMVLLSTVLWDIYLHGTVAHFVVDIYMVLLPTVLWGIYLHGTVSHCVVRYISTWYCFPLCCVDVLVVCAVLSSPFSEFCSKLDVPLIYIHDVHSRNGIIYCDVNTPSFCVIQWWIDSSPSRSSTFQAFGRALNCYNLTINKHSMLL